MAKITLPRILSFLSENQQFVVVDDGSFTEGDVEIIGQLSPKVKVITRNQREEFVLEKLANRTNCIKYRNEFPFAFKLLDIPLLAQMDSPRYTYTDADIIYIKNCESYFNRNVNTYLRTDAIKLSVKLQHALIKYRWTIPYKFNAGYLSFDTSKFDLDFIENYLGLPDVYNFPWLSEQTCWALIFGRSGESYCPGEDQFVCDELFSGPTEKTLAIHLISNLKRHVAEWSEFDYKINENNIVFEKSRNVTLLDWGQKSVKRILRGI